MIFKSGIMVFMSSAVRMKIRTGNKKVMGGG